MLLKQPFPRAQRSCPDLTWVAELLCSMTRFWSNFSFLSPFSSWSTWHPGSSWVSGKCWYLSNSRVVWNDTFTCGKRISNDHHIRWHCVQEIQSTHCTKAQAHIFPLEPKAVMPAAKFPLEQSNTIKEKSHSYFLWIQYMEMECKGEQLTSEPQGRKCLQQDKGFDGTNSVFPKLS